MSFFRYRSHLSLYRSLAAVSLMAVVAVSGSWVGLDTPMSSALTTVPTKMHFQGRLTDSTGNIKPNGTYNMRLKLYTVSSAGTAVWSEDRLVSASQGITVTNGLFSIKLGDVTTLPASLFASGELYLEVELPSPATATSASPSWTEGPMTPRNQMATSAYAYNAETLDGLDSSDFAAATGSNNYIQNQAVNPQSASFNISGNGTIGGNLEVVGDAYLAYGSVSGDFDVSGSLSSSTQYLLGGTTVLNSARALQNITGITVQNTAGTQTFFDVNTANSTISVTNITGVSAATSTPNTSTVVTTGSGSVSAAKGLDGFARMSLYGGAQDLIYVQCTDVDCTSPVTTTVDSTGTVGFDSDIEIAPDGFARISYYDLTNTDLKYVQCTNAACTTSNITTLDGSGFSAGVNSALEIGSDGFARISYADSTNSDLKFIQCTNASCSTRNTTTVDSAGTVGGQSDLAIASDGFARISYVDSGNADLKYAQCTDAACTTSTSSVVDSVGSVGDNSSLVLGSDGFGRIVYTDTTNGKTKYAQCTNNACSTRATTVVAESSSGTSAADILIGSDGYPRFTYPSTLNQAMMYRSCLSADCSTHRTAQVRMHSWGSSFGGGSMYLGSDNIPRIILAGGGTTSVVHIRLANSSGATSAGSSLGSSQTNGLNELYVKRADVEGAVTVRNASGSTSEPALELLGSGTYLRAADTLSSNLRFEVSDNAFTYDSPNGQRFAIGSSGAGISNNGTGDTLQISKYDSSGSALKLFVFESTASAITVNNEDYGVDTFVLDAMGEVTHQTLWSATEAFKIMGPASDKLFVVDNTNFSVNIGNPAADSTGVVLVLDTKNTAGDPTGKNGAMYYNSSAGKFRCYENGAWKDCIASGSAILNPIWPDGAAGTPLNHSLTSSSSGTTCSNIGFGSGTCAMYQVPAGKTLYLTSARLMNGTGCSVLTNASGGDNNFPPLIGSGTDVELIVPRAIAAASYVGFKCPTGEAPRGSLSGVLVNTGYTPLNHSLTSSSSGTTCSNIGFGSGTCAMYQVPAGKTLYLTSAKLQNGTGCSVVTNVAGGDNNFPPTIGTGTSFDLQAPRAIAAASYVGFKCPTGEAPRGSLSGVLY